jgi:hypothetical protein
MTNDIHEELKVALHKHAGALPPRPDMARAAIRQAHGIRRRRRIGGAVAAAALVAVAVPIGLEAGDSLSRRGQEVQPVDATPSPPDRSAVVSAAQVSVDLEELTAGAAPAIPYVAQRQLITDDSTVDLGVSPDLLTRVAFAGGQPHLSVRDERGMLTLRSDDKELPISDGPWSSPDHRYLAYLGDGSLTVVDTDDGSEATLPTGPTDYLSLVSFVGDEVYLVHANDDALLRWRVGARTAVAMNGVMRATAVSADGELIADMREIDDLSASSCTRVMSAADGDVLWETCKHRIEGFSPDGGYVWGSAAYGDGAGDTYAAVLDARTGDPIMRIDGPDDADRQLSIVSGRFESDTTLLLSTEQAGEAALVRCDLTAGTCKRATDLADVRRPYEGRPPYRLLD